MSFEDIDNRFKYHAPDDVKIEQHSWVRHEAHAVAREWESNLPEGREKALAITKLEEAMFWANAAIARN